MLSLVCAISTPFFMDAEEPTKANTMNSSCCGAIPDQITPPAEPLFCNGARVDVNADFIYWKAQEDGVQYAFNGGLANGGISSGINAERGKMHSANFVYKPGFKVGLNVLTGHDDWDVFAQYTWLNVPSSSTKSSATGNTTNNALQGTNIYGNLGVSNIYVAANSQWGINFNVWDANFGRKFWLSKRLEIRPSLGVKFSYIQVHLRTLGQLVVSGVPTTSTIEYASKTREFGIGIRSGIESAYYLWDQWSIFGDFAVTGLWNDFHSARKDTYTPAPGQTSSTNLNVTSHPYTISSVAEMTLGMRFETIFGKGKYMYMLQAGWETQVWFNQGQSIHCHVPSAPGNLSLSGLTLKTGFWF